MFKICLFFVFAIIAQPAFADLTTLSTFSPISHNHYNIRNRNPYVQTHRHHTQIKNMLTQNPYFSNKELNALEKYAMNKTYKRENDINRLERLENLAFGAIQNGDLFSRYKNVENVILSRPKYKQHHSVLNNLANYFNGQATGFTPSIIPYSSYNNFGNFTSSPYISHPSITPQYQNSRVEYHSNGIFGKRFDTFGNDYGTNSSIRILD